MAQLFIKSLTCNETEDWTGSDGCLLEVFTDAGRKTYSQDLNNGEVWEINDTLPFTVRARIRLWASALLAPLQQLVTTWSTRPIDPRERWTTVPYALSVTMHRTSRARRAGGNSMSMTYES